MKAKVTLVQHIRQQESKNPGASGEFTNLMYQIVVGAKLISKEVNKAGLGEDILGLTGKTNIQGEKVQKLDEYANNILIKILRDSGSIGGICSEENEIPIKISTEQSSAKYIFMMDPLDGSSNIDVNVSIGTIFSIYRKKSPGDALTDMDFFQKADQQVAAGYVIYGSSSMFVYTTGHGVHGFTLDPEIGEFFLSHPDLNIPAKGSIYSVNEGNGQLWEEEQKKLVQYFKEEDKAS
ncbi:MAG: class 1 fructose-1,6-bisphosphatase, partial [Nitrospinales bacterium]